MTGADMNIGIKSEVLKMTKEFMNKELAYDLSISPFLILHRNRVISDEELAKITQYLQENINHYLYQTYTSNRLI